MNDVLNLDKPDELANVFAGAIFREDQWRQLNAHARAWAGCAMVFYDLPF